MLKTIAVPAKLDADARAVSGSSLPIEPKHLARGEGCRTASSTSIVTCCLFFSLFSGFKQVLAWQGRPPEKTTQTAAPARQDRPKYLNLRYDEDYSFLDAQPGTYDPDFFDPIKNIRFGPDWRVTIGGEFRFRLEAETNKAFGATEPAQDTFALFRYMLHADLRYRDNFRLFAQGIAAFDEDRDLARRAIDEDRWDVHQLFFDVRLLGEDHPLTLRVGRQELQYGHQRFVSPLDWATVRRRFDGVKLFARSRSWDFDLWYVKPVIVQRNQRDRFDEDVDFYGAYATYKGWRHHGLDLYLLVLEDRGDARNPNGRRGDRNVYMLGSRFWGRTGGFDYEAEVAGQWGHWARDTIQAWAVALDGGYTFAERPWSPRIGAGLDWATGDENPFDDAVQTFNQFFPLGHAYFGYLDLVGRQNIRAINVNLSAWPVAKKLRTAMTYHAFWLDDTRDALYDAGGGAIRRDAFGKSGREIGQELDVTFLWTLDRHSDVLLGYSYLWEGNFINESGAGESADLIYLQYSYKF